MPLFEVNYPANANKLCQLLLQVASYEMISVEKMHKFFWGSQGQLEIPKDSLLEKIESLGFEGTFVFVNLGSALVFFGL